MQDRVERPRTKLVAVPTQLLNQGEPVDGLLGRVVEDVDLDEAEEEARSMYRFSIS
jgi:hypothetical protein